MKTTTTLALCALAALTIAGMTACGGIDDSGSELITDTEEIRSSSEVSEKEVASACAGAACTCTPPAANPCPAGCVAESVLNNCVQNGNACNANPNGTACTFTCSTPVGAACPGWAGAAAGVCAWIQTSCPTRKVTPVLKVGN